MRTRLLRLPADLVIKQTSADVAQLVELQISNLNVASSNLVVRSISSPPAAHEIASTDAKNPRLGSGLFLISRYYTLSLCLVEREAEEF